MCGIWLYLTHNQTDISYETIINNFMAISGRGPDNFKLISLKDKYTIGFHRLSIMDVSVKGSQPFEYLDKTSNIKYTCICNGEIYNAKFLKEHYLNDFQFESESDCEVIIPLYLKFQDKFVSYLDGVFAIVLIKEENDDIEYFLARDRIGVRPMYIGLDENKNYVIGSELKSIKNIAINALQFTPGSIKRIKYDGKFYNERTEKYYNLNQITRGNEIFDNYNFEENNIKSITDDINKIFTECVRKRLISDRPVCALLSGGLDSSLVCSIASKLLKENGQKLYTFSIGIPGSPDNEYAKKVAEYIDSEHTVVHISQDDAIGALSDVIWATETYDITTVRASTGQYLISKYIAENTNFKVVLSGDGSDEVTNGYLENFLAPSNVELHKNAIDRLMNIHYYDVLRADRATSIHGLELRVPFLDVSFVNYYLNINCNLRKPNEEHCEKWLLRKSFENGYLPNEVLWRKKEAFSDGISSEDNSWHSIIKNKCEIIIDDEDLKNANLKYEYCTPISKESYYFRTLFDEYYGNKFSNIIPAFWMPKWSSTNDPSARSLEVYNYKSKV